MMMIERNIKVTDRKSLSELKAYVTKQRDLKKIEATSSFTYIKKRWSPKRVAGDFLKNTALPFFIHRAFDIVRSVGKTEEHETAQSWVDMVEQLVESYISRKAEEMSD